MQAGTASSSTIGLAGGNQPGPGQTRLGGPASDAGPQQGPGRVRTNLPSHGMAFAAQRPAAINLIKPMRLSRKISGRSRGRPGPAGAGGPAWPGPTQRTGGHAADNDDRAGRPGPAFQQQAAVSVGQRRTRRAAVARRRVLRPV